MTESLANQTVGDLSQMLADATPAPGGGATAALSGALAASLVSMVCRLTIGRERFAAESPVLQEVLARAEILRGTLTALADEDAAAYEAVIATFRLPKASEEERAALAAALQRTLRGATEVPLKMTGVCSEVASLARQTVEMGNPNASGDAAVAALLAEAAAQGAALNVQINTARMVDRTFKEQSLAASQTWAEEAAAARAAVLEILKNRDEK